MEYITNYVNSYENDNNDYTLFSGAVQTYISLQQNGLTCNNEDKIYVTSKYVLYETALNHYITIPIHALPSHIQDYITGTNDDISDEIQIYLDLNQEPNTLEKIRIGEVLNDQLIPTQCPS